jgi:hypothetical protein
MADLVTEAEVTTLWPEFPTKVEDADARALLITAASDWVERYCQREFTQATVTETISPAGVARLILRRPPVTSITSVTLDDTALAATEYVLDPDGMTLWRGEAGSGRRRSAWPAGVGSLVVVYVGGYATIPAQVKLATVETIKNSHDTTRASSVYSFEAIGDYQYKTAEISEGGAAAPQSIAMKLRPYRLAWGMA